MERAARAAKLVLYLVALCVAFAGDMQDKVLNGSRPCGLYDGPCCGPLSIGDMQSDSLFGTTTTYPAPFGHFYEGARHQILYRASELQAMGFSGGKINELGFNIQQVSGTNVYFEWNIKMGCTTQDVLATTNWINGLTDVNYADTLNIAAGWNMFVFPSSFNWDGVSNLVIEVCFNNDPHLPTWTNNSPTYYSMVGFDAVHWINQDANPLICTTDGAFSNVGENRPNTRFVYCGGVRASDNYNIQLSKRRVEAAKRYLIRNGMQAPSRILIEYYGELRPVSDNKSVEGMSRNRRVEIRILPMNSIRSSYPAGFRTGKKKDQEPGKVAKEPRKKK